MIHTEGVEGLQVSFKRVVSVKDSPSVTSQREWNTDVGTK